MTDAVETMAWSGETPWHGLGTEVSDDLSPEQMLKEAGLDWPVEKRQVYFMDKSGWATKVPDRFALVRTTDDAPLSVVGPNYKPVQNEEAMDFFTKFVATGDMKMETAGSLWNGRYVWGLARMGIDFKLGKSDEVRGYLLLLSPHVHGMSMVIQFTPIRVVCWNTLTFAIGGSLKGTANAFRMPHSIEFTESVRLDAEQALGLATEQVSTFQEASTLLSKKRAGPKAVEHYFEDVLKFDVKTARKNKDGSTRVPRNLPKFQMALESAPGQQLPSALGTWWGALNAVTAVVDHDLGRDRSTALRNAWIGHAANVKRRAFDLAVQRAKKS